MTNQVRFDSLLQRRLDRRDLLTGGLALLGLGAARRVSGGSLFQPSVFPLGVASGDPSPDGVVLWTRLALEPLQGGGMPPEDVEVVWEVARDERMADVVQRGTTLASATLGHSVHVEVDGLEPGRWYWYRFRTGVDESTVGRTRTLPAPGAPADRLRFAFASCQHYEQGVLHRVPPHDRGRSRSRLPPRRLHLRVRGTRRARTKAHRRRDRAARRLSQPVRALPQRPRPAGGARGIPLGGHVGRPRGGQQLRERRLGGGGAAGRAVPPAPRGRLPGLLRAHAAPPFVAAQRPRPAALPRLRLGRSGLVPRARHAAVPHRPAVRRPPRRRLRRHPRPGRHAARRDAGALARGRASTGRRRAGTSFRSRS